MRSAAMFGVVERGKGAVACCNERSQDFRARTRMHSTRFYREIEIPVMALLSLPSLFLTFSLGKE